MRSKRQCAFLVTVGAMLLTVACNTTRLVDDTEGPEWSSVLPSTALLDAIGATLQLTVVDAVGAPVQVPGLAWRTLDPAIVQIDGSGRAAAVAPGMGRIIVETARRADTAMIEVRQDVFVVAVSPPTASVAVGATQQYTASLRDRNGHPVTGRAVSWSSSDENVALVTGAGLVMGRAAGSAFIFATSGGKAGSASAIVIAPPPPPPPPPATVATVSVTPASAGVEVGSTVQLTATLRDANGAVLTGRTITWASTDDNITLVTAAGLVFGRSAGSVVITATSEGKSGSASVIVTATPPPPPAPVATVTVTPAPASVQVGSTVQLTATLRDASGNVLTGRTVTWTTSASGVATVSASGLVTGVAAGSATISATSEGKSGTASVTVTPVPVATVVVSPSTASVQVGSTVQLTATARDASGSALTGRPFTWASSNASVATVNGSGLVTGVAAGSVTISATTEGKSGTASVTVTLVPVASVSVTPTVGTIQTGQTIQLTATARDANGNALSGRSVTWQSSNTSVATVATTGLVTGLTAGSVTITATSEGKSGTAAITVTAAPPPPAGSINVRVSRLASSSGPVLVSSGIPLPAGRLRASQLATVKVLVNGAEPSAVYVEALSGTHPDGSLRTVLVQFNYDVPTGAGLSGQLIFGQTRTAPPLAKPTQDRGDPAAVILPFDPVYLLSTDLVGSTLTTAASAAISATFQKYETNFRTYADLHWNARGATWTENYYDRAHIYYAWWARTGELEYWRRATALALSYRRDYLEANGYRLEAKWSMAEGLERHYLLTGDEASRYAIGRLGDHFTHPYYMDGLACVGCEMENRIQGRLLMAFLTAWKLNAPSQTGASWATLLPTALTKILASQAPDGAYRFTLTNNQCGYNKPFMVGILNDAFIKYYTYFNADARIPVSIQKSVDYMWAFDWDASARAFVYLDGPCPGFDGGPVPDLNNLIVNGYAWTYKQTRNSIYRDRADQIFTAGVELAWLGGTKQFSENYTNSFHYLAYRQ